MAGDANNKAFNASLVAFLENDFFPECKKLNSNTTFAFYPDSDLWCQRVEDLFSHMKLEKSGKTYFNFDKTRFNKKWRDHIPHGFAIKKITQELIDSIDDNKDFIDYIKFAWISTQEFFDKGMGYCARDENDFASICISVFASENEREVGIKTFPNFQRKGLGYLTACAYIEDCLTNNWLPVWSCFSDNQSSIKLAEKLGYTLESSHPIYFAEIGN